MDLVISKKHTAYARRSAAFSCPVAKALRELGFKAVAVEGPGAMVDDQYYPFPSRLRAAIFSYDGGATFKCGTYRIPGLKKPSNKK
jgi:hypothetical protein